MGSYAITVMGSVGQLEVKLEHKKPPPKLRRKIKSRHEKADLAFAQIMLHVFKSEKEEDQLQMSKSSIKNMFDLEETKFTSRIAARETLAQLAAFKNSYTSEAE